MKKDMLSNDLILFTRKEVENGGQERRDMGL